MRFFRLSGPHGPWGDYGHILVAGMSSHLPREDGLIQLERVGPFMPPITFPGIGDLVVDGSARAALEASGLSGGRLIPVVKRHVVNIDWRSWPRDAALPHELPEEVEPENYILSRAHDPEVADALGDLWEVQLQSAVKTIREERRLMLLADTWDGTDLFHPDGTRIIAASQRAADWFQAQFPEWVELSELPIASG